MLVFRFPVSPNQLACRGSPLDISARAEVQFRPKAWKDNQTGEKGFLAVFLQYEGLHHIQILFAEKN